MYTKFGTTIWTDIWLKLIIFCAILFNCNGFKNSVYETSTINRNDDGTTLELEPLDSESYEWWQIVIIVVVPLLPGVLAFGLIWFMRKTFRKIRRGRSNAHTNEENSVPYNRPFRPQEFDDWPRPHGTDFYIRRSSLQDGFMAQLAANRQMRRPNLIATQIQPRSITVNERPPQQITRSANDVVDDPPPYESAVQEHEETVLPRKVTLDATNSFDSDISIIESPPSYFMVQETFPTTRSSDRWIVQMIL